MDLAAPPDSVWKALGAAYAALGLTPTVVDSRTRTYGVQRFTQPRLGGKRTAEYVRCAFPIPVGLEAPVGRFVSRPIDVPETSA